MRQINREILDRLEAHFEERPTEYLKPEQVSDMTAGDISAVRSGLAWLHGQGYVRGEWWPEYDWPTLITGVR